MFSVLRYHRKDRSLEMSDGPPAHVKPKGRVQVLPVTSETTASTQIEKCRDKKNWLLQLKSKLLFTRETRRVQLGRAQKIDMASRILFPLLYALYNAGYWYVYLKGVEFLA